MGVNFFQNGVSLGASAGWGGYTGGNNYVVRYDFTTPEAGASGVTLTLGGIYYGHGAGTQGFGFKLGSSPAAWANAHGEAPDSTLGYMSYSDAAGYGCTMTAAGLNLAPYTTYYLFVYAATGGTEYYTGWNCTAPAIALTGSYTQPVSAISSVSPQTATGSSVSLIMARAGDSRHKATFSHDGEILAVSEPFAAALSYTCPREWMAKAPTAQSMTVDVSVQMYSDAACTLPVGAAQTAAFVLTADADMRPRLADGAVTSAALNPDGAAAGITGFIAGVSRARVSFAADMIDMSACAGAAIAAYRVSVRGRTISAAAGTVDTGVLTGDCTLSCSVVDTRGREDTLSIGVTMLPYVPPFLSDIAAARCNADGTDNERGAYCKLRAALGYTPLGGANSAAVSVSLRPTGGAWGAETALDGFESGKWSHKWSAPAVLGGDLTQDGYTLRLRVTDAVGGAGVYTARLYSRQWAMKFNAHGTAVGFGMSPTAENAVQLPDTWRLYAGALVLSSGSYGTAPPEQAELSPVEGQLYFYVTD